ncbi:MAG: M20/M25/M40 family metallo-hydrolase [Candidatus Acidiferrales bacterium]
MLALISLLIAFSSLLLAQSPSAKRAPESLDAQLQWLVETPAVSGHEADLAAAIRERVHGYTATTDNLGDLIVTVGSGAPHRVIAAPMDEPGYVISDITHDGYLRVQRLPQNGILPLFEELYSGQPVRIQSPSGPWLNGVVAGLSVHLRNPHPPSPNDIDDMYIDIGASSADEARRAGADLLAPLVIDRQLARLQSSKYSAPSIGDRFGDAALLQVLAESDLSKTSGTLTFVFLAQQWTGARGLERILTTLLPDELVYVGRLTPSGPIPDAPSLHKAPRQDTGTGVLIGLPDTGAEAEKFPAELQKLAAAGKIPLRTDYSAPLLHRSYLPQPNLPDKVAHLAIATEWPSTPAEEIDLGDLRQLVALLQTYATGAPSAAQQTPESGAAALPTRAPAPPASSAASSTPRTPVQYLKELVETYGSSGHEGDVREKIKSELPRWARPETDDSGNLILHLRSGSASASAAKTPKILIVAHMDEIGFVVKSISKDGRLEVGIDGGGELRYFVGHAAVAHSAKGAYPAVMELPTGWDQGNFTWPVLAEALLRVDVGARTPEQAAQLGFRSGDWVTIPKKYRPLAGKRANARSFDDRVGCSALVSAVGALGPDFKDRDVTFVWSTSEEIGLVGAAAVAKRLAAGHQPPDFVFAVDTFVSSDSPIESHRFADAELGKGFVIRAVDNSNIVSRESVEKVLTIAKSNQIAAQYGVTGGGNDGSAFLRFGSADVALGWPLRYSHSPAEVIDTRDLEGLAHIIAAIARNW